MEDKTRFNLSRREFLNLTLKAGGILLVDLTLSGCNNNIPSQEPTLEYLPTLTDIPTSLPSATPTETIAPTEVLHSLWGELQLGQLEFKPNEIDQLRFLGTLNFDFEIPYLRPAERSDSITPDAISDTLTSGNWNTKITFLQKKQTDLLETISKKLKSSLTSAKFFIANDKNKEYILENIIIENSTADIYSFGDDDRSVIVVIVREETSIPDKPNYFLGFADNRLGLTFPFDGNFYRFYPLSRITETNQERMQSDLLGVADIDGTVLKQFRIGLDRFILPPFTNVDNLIHQANVFPIERLEQTIYIHPKFNFLVESEFPDGFQYKVKEFKGEKVWVITNSEDQIQFIRSPYYNSYLKVEDITALTSVDWGEAEKNGIKEIYRFNRKGTEIEIFKPSNIYKNSKGGLIFLDHFGCKIAEYFHDVRRNQRRLFVLTDSDDTLIPYEIWCQVQTKYSFSSVQKLIGKDSTKKYDAVSRSMIVRVAKGNKDPLLSTIDPPEWFKNEYDYYYSRHIEIIRWVTAEWERNLQDPRLRLIAAIIRATIEFQKMQYKYKNLTKADGSVSLKQYMKSNLYSFTELIANIIAGINRRDQSIAKYLNHVYQFERNNEMRYPYNKIRIQFSDPVDFYNMAIMTVRHSPLINYQTLIVGGNLVWGTSDWNDKRAGWIASKNLSANLFASIHANNSLLNKSGDISTMENLLLNALDYILIEQNGYPVFCAKLFPSND